MSARLEGVKPHTRRDRLSLDGWRSRNCSLPGEHSDLTNFSDPIQRWESWLCGARNQWSIDQHRLPEAADDWLRGGAWARRRLSKSDAAELLGLAFAAIDGSGQ